MLHSSQQMLLCYSACLTTNISQLYSMNNICFSAILHGSQQIFLNYTAQITTSVFLQLGRAHNECYKAIRDNSQQNVSPQHTITQNKCFNTIWGQLTQNVSSLHITTYTKCFSTTRHDPQPKFLPYSS